MSSCKINISRCGSTYTDSPHLFFVDNTKIKQFTLNAKNNWVVIHKIVLSVTIQAILDDQKF